MFYMLDAQITGSGRLFHPLYHQWKKGIVISIDSGVWVLKISGDALLLAWVDGQGKCISTYVYYLINYFI